MVCVGLVLGSFANVIIYRLPKGESVISPRSRCQKCLQPIRWFENIPLVSYLFLRGKCNRCGVRISPRYFVVEALMGLGFGALFWCHGLNFYLVEHSIFYFGLLTVSMIDIDHMILPDSFTLSGIVIGLVGSLFNSGRGFTEAFVGVLMGGGFLWLVAYLYYVWRK